MVTRVNPDAEAEPAAGDAEATGGAEAAPDTPASPRADGEQALAEVEPAYPPGLRNRPQPVGPFGKEVGGQTQGR